MVINVTTSYVSELVNDSLSYHLKSCFISDWRVETLALLLFDMGFKRVTLNIGFLTLLLVISYTPGIESKPQYFFTLPAASSSTHVVRDALGNQATSYAYQDGHSSAVAVSRKDVSKHLAFVPAAAPIVYHHAPVIPHYTYTAGTPYYYY